jgi:hypothetical protein
VNGVGTFSAPVHTTYGIDNRPLQLSLTQARKLHCLTDTQIQGTQIKPTEMFGKAEDGSWDFRSAIVRVFAQKFSLSH